METIDIKQIPSIKKLIVGGRIPIQENIKLFINLSYDWAKENNKEIIQFVYVPLGLDGTYIIAYDTKISQQHTTS